MPWLGVLITAQTATVIFSMFAGVAWLTSATGRRLFHKPWLGTAPLMEDPIERVSYQARWSTLAALFAAIAAMPQIGVLAKHLP